MKTITTRSPLAKRIYSAAPQLKAHPAIHGRRPVAPWLILVVLAVGAFATSCAGDRTDQAGLAGPQTRELYRQGNLLYEGEKYAEASRIYERIIERGVRNGHVFYNLGNAYYKQNRIGRAILAYERASRLLPRDGDLHNNLDLAKERTADQITAEVPWFGRQALDGVTVNEATIAATTAAFIASLALVCYLLARQTKARVQAGYGLLVTCLVFLIAIGFAGIKIYDSEANEKGIVLSRTAVVRTSPDEGSDPAFTLHEGARVRLVEGRGDWMRIGLPDGKNGWLSRNDFERI